MKYPANKVESSVHKVAQPQDDRDDRVSSSVNQRIMIVANTSGEYNKYMTNEASVSMQ